MKFDDIWAQLVRKKSDLSVNDAVVELTSKNLKLLLRQVYDKGKASVPSEKKSDSFDSIFGDIFRK